MLVGIAHVLQILCPFQLMMIVRKLSISGILNEINDVLFAKSLQNYNYYA